ncbi:hypothetical protein EBR66_07845 [bacterium]|nr:hypothetical protein [bacterium]
MTDPVFHIKGDFIVLNYEGILIKYIKKDSIETISTTSNCLRISFGKDDTIESVIFSSLESKDAFLNTLLDALSEKSLSTKHVLAKVNHDLASCIRTIIDKLKELKEEIQTNTMVEITKVIRSVKKLEEKVESLEYDGMPDLIPIDTLSDISDSVSEISCVSEVSEDIEKKNLEVEDILLTSFTILFVIPLVLSLMYGLYITTMKEL